jgi:hypothetical protein
MPTRRTLELVVLTVVLMHPVVALARLWSHKTLATSPAGSVSHSTAEIVSVIA